MSEQMNVLSAVGRIVCSDGREARLKKAIDITGHCPHAHGRAIVRYGTTDGGAKALIECSDSESSASADYTRGDWESLANDPEFRFFANAVWLADASKVAKLIIENAP